MLYLFFITALLLSATAVQARAPVPTKFSLFGPKAISRESSSSTFPTLDFAIPTPTPAPIAAPSCGIDNYDFTNLMSSDWSGLADDYSEIYYMNLCHTVTNLWCTLNPNTAAVQACQVSPDDTQYTYNLMSNDTSATSWSYINGKNATAGIQFKSQTGDGGGGCPHGGKRITIGNLVCGNSTGVVTNVVEQPACTYTFTIPNKLVCQPGQRVDEYAAEVERVQRVMESMRQGEGMAKNV